MKSLLKSIQYDMLDFIEIESEDESGPSYTSADVSACVTNLLDFMAAIESEIQTETSAKEHVATLLFSLNDLNESCDDDLIDNNQREDIVEFIEKALSAANITLPSDDITAQWRIKAME